MILLYISVAEALPCPFILMHIAAEEAKASIIAGLLATDFNYSIDGVLTLMIPIVHDDII